ncbi:MAG: oligosaccharide flippase family protein [Chloroflexota bacterium]
MARQLFAQLSKESFVYGFTAAAAKLVGFILVPLYARMLTQSGFGILDLVTTGTAILSSVLILGMDSSIAIIFYKTEDPTERRTIASTFLVFEIVFTLIVCALLLPAAEPIALLAFGDASLTPYVQIALATVPFAIYITMFLDIARLIRIPTRYMVISLGNLIFTSVLIVLAVVVYGLGVWGVLTATLIGSVVFSLVGFYTTRSQYGPFFSRTVLRRMILLGLPLVPAALSLWIIGSSNRWFVLHITSSAEQVAILALATRLAAPVVLVVTAFQIAWVPFSLSIARQDAAERVYTRTLLYFLAVTFAILLPLTLWAGPIIQLFSTDAYLPAANLIALTGMISISSGAYYIVATGINLSGKTIHIGWTTLVAAGVSILLNLALIPVLGVLGAAFAGLVASLTPVVLLYIMSQRIHPLPYDLPAVLTLSGLGALLLLAATLLHLSDPLFDFAARVVILAIFPAALLALGVIRPRDLREMMHMLSGRMRRGADV